MTEEELENFLNDPQNKMMLDPEKWRLRDRQLYLMECISDQTDGLFDMDMETQQRILHATATAIRRNQAQFIKWKLWKRINKNCFKRVYLPGEDK